MLAACTAVARKPKLQALRVHWPRQSNWKEQQAERKRPTGPVFVMASPAFREGKINGRVSLRQANGPVAQWHGDVAVQEQVGLELGLEAEPN